MMTNSETNSLRDLVKVLNDGIDFYTEAKDKVKSNAVRLVFERMSAIREGAVGRLQPYIVFEKGEKETGHTLGGILREHYAKILAAIKDDSEHVYIEQLEEVEDKTLEKIRDAIEEVKAPGVQATLQDIYPTLKRCHDEMSRLQRATA
ncbi:ferritin-like domain-containing protein [Hahella sp. NBU794]|uniref:ferritin-like domain-containing protein n=2 Tax=unclassified Hahella TaxID=2624107 RepID=UPI003D6DD423